MALRLGRTFSDGIRRVFTRTGGALFAALLGIQFLLQTSINTAVLGSIPPEASGEVAEMLGLALPVSGTVGTLLAVIAFALNFVFFVGLSRALTRPMAELSTVPATLFTRRLGRATLSMAVGGVVVGLLVFVGIVLLVLPGIFLAVCFLFFIFAVGVEDRGVDGALRRSWDLSRGNRLKLAVIVIFAGVIGGVVGTAGALFDLAGAPIVAELLTSTPSSLLFVVLYGSMAAAYLQLTADEDGVYNPNTADPAAATVDVEER